MKLEASDTKAAIVEWAKSEISATSDVRAEVGKFFFSTSASAVAFLWGLVLLGASALVAMYIFWPVIGHWQPDSDIQEAHATLIRRLAYEGVAWAVLWFVGVAIGLWATLSP